MTKACPTEFVCVRCRSSGISSFSCRLFRICGRVLFHLPYHTVFSLELLSIVCTRSAVRSTGPGPSESFCPPCFVGRQRRLRFDCSVLTESYANKCAHTLGRRSWRRVHSLPIECQRICGDGGKWQISTVRVCVCVCRASTTGFLL